MFVRERAIWERMFSPQQNQALVRILSTAAFLQNGPAGFPTAFIKYIFQPAIVWIRTCVPVVAPRAGIIDRIVLHRGDPCRAKSFDVDLQRFAVRENRFPISIILKLKNWAGCSCFLVRGRCDDCSSNVGGSDRAQMRTFVNNTGSVADIESVAVKWSYR